MRRYRWCAQEVETRVIIGKNDDAGFEAIQVDNLNYLGIAFSYSRKYRFHWSTGVFKGPYNEESAYDVRRETRLEHGTSTCSPTCSEMLHKDLRRPTRQDPRIALDIMSILADLFPTPSKTSALHVLGSASFCSGKRTRMWRQWCDGCER